VLTLEFSITFHSNQNHLRSTNPLQQRLFSFTDYTGLTSCFSVFLFLVIVRLSDWTISRPPSAMITDLWWQRVTSWQLWFTSSSMVALRNTWQSFVSVDRRPGMRSAYRSSISFVARVKYLWYRIVAESSVKRIPRYSTRWIFTTLVTVKSAGTGEITIQKVLTIYSHAHGYNVYSTDDSVLIRAC